MKMKSIKRDLFCVCLRSAQGAWRCVCRGHTPRHTQRYALFLTLMCYLTLKSLSKSWREKPRLLEAPQDHQLFLLDLCEGQTPKQDVNQDTLWTRGHVMDIRRAKLGQFRGGGGYSLTEG